MIERVRRVVMGERSSGKSEFTHIEDVEPLRFGESVWWAVWGWDEEPNLAHLNTAPYVARSLLPPPGGLRVWAQRLAAAGETSENDAPALEKVQRLISAEPAGMFVDPTRPGMHRTDTIDIGVVVSGEVTTEADDGSSVVLGPGDVYIQNGGLHNWHAAPDNPAHVVFIVVAADRRFN